MSLYAATVPFWSNSLRCLQSILGKAIAHAQEQGYEPDVLLEMRLFPDMFPLVRQVQIATDVVARAGARLTQAELPEFPDEETSLVQLQARIDAGLAFLTQLREADFAGAADRQIDVPVGGGNSMPMSGQRYAASFATPNIYFHITTVYNILRSNGVPLGKRDYLVAAE